MINSLKDIVNESAFNQDGLVGEMGVKRPERLAQSHMGRVRQSTIDRNQQLANRPVARSFAEISVDLVRAFKGVRRLDITMEKPSNSRSYYPRFPQPIVDLMNELKNVAASQFANEFGRWRDVYPGDDNAIHFRTEGPSDFQRSHFPNGGIPSGLRGAGLGYKMYRTLLKYSDYISSNPSGTTEKDKAWGSMLTYKSNPDGSPSEDDAHAIIGSGNWMAMDKSMSTAAKIDVANRFIERIIGRDNTKPDRFDMDDELLAILPDESLVLLNRDYLNSLVTDNRLTSERIQAILAARTEAQRREEEQRERERVEAAERRTREEAATRQRLADRITQYGADPDAEWNVGDFIVVKRYLYDASYSSLPIRRVILNRNSSYVAASIATAIQIDNGQLEPENAGGNRTTTDKSQWIKVIPEAIPDLSRVNLSTTEQAYMRSFINPEEIERRRESERQANVASREADRTQNAERANQPGVFSEYPTSGSDLKRRVEARGSLPAIDILKKIRGGDFAKFIVLGPGERSLLRSAFGVPVYVAFSKSGRSIRPVDSVEDLLNRTIYDAKLINVVTGHIIERPFAGLDLMAYELEQVTDEDKLRARAGDRYYIANHMNNWGIFASCDYTTRNTANQPFIYLNTFGGATRPTPVRLDLLRKVSGQPIEL